MEVESIFEQFRRFCTFECSRGVLFMTCRAYLLTIYNGVLQVVRKSSVEVPQQPGWSRGVRASPFASRLVRTAYPRPTFPGAMRGRLAIRGNARSFQWKRGAADSVDAGKPSQATPVTPGSQMVTPVTRSFTYTRTEPKQDVGATANV